nr:MAG TPA: 4-hydroxy-3-methylbut-2-en-1-yl diphosphate synthase [Microviridae sp.]
MESLNYYSPVPYLIGTGLGDTVRVSHSSSFASG